MLFTGNIISGADVGYGKVLWHNGVIERVEITDNIRRGADWGVPGFIDTHLHGAGDGDFAEDISLISEFLAGFGVTGFLPTSDSAAPEVLLDFIDEVRALSGSSPKSKVLGAHLEGPFLSHKFCGGMDPEQLRLPDHNEVSEWLHRADNCIKIVTLAPELPGAEKVIKQLVGSGVTVSLGHTALGAAELPQAVALGVSRACHLFDAYDGRNILDGVSQIALSDAVLIDDRLMVEIICDGCHVPPGLLQLAVRAAGVERIVAVTDSMKGAGKPDGIYTAADGRAYLVDNSDVCRTVEEPHLILGSCLTMNRAFYNLIHKFGFTPAQAAAMTAANPARSIGMGHKLGMLRAGFAADIVLLADDMLTVKATVVDGKNVLN